MDAFFYLWLFERGRSSGGGRCEYAEPLVLPDWLLSVTGFVQANFRTILLVLIAVPLLLFVMRHFFNRLHYR